MAGAPRGREAGKEAAAITWGWGHVALSGAGGSSREESGKEEGRLFPGLGAAVLFNDWVGEPFVFGGAEGSDAAGGMGGPWLRAAGFC